MEKKSWRFPYFCKSYSQRKIGIFLWATLYLSAVDNGKNIAKHRLSAGEIVSPNQRCCHRNNSLQGLNEDKGLSSKSILVMRQREGWGKTLCSVIQVYQQRVYLSKFLNFLPQKTENKVRNFQHYFEIGFRSSLKRNEKLFFHIWPQKLSSCYLSVSHWLTESEISVYYQPVHFSTTNEITLKKQNIFL